MEGNKSEVIMIKGTIIHVYCGNEVTAKRKILTDDLYRVTYYCKHCRWSKHIIKRIEG